MGKFSKKGEGAEVRERRNRTVTSQPLEPAVELQVGFVITYPSTILHLKTYVMMRNILVFLRQRHFYQHIRNSIFKLQLYKHLLIFSMAGKDH